MHIFEYVAIAARRIQDFVKGVRIRGGSIGEGLTLVLYLCSRGSGGHSPTEAMGYLAIMSF